MLAKYTYLHSDRHHYQQVQTSLELEETLTPEESDAVEEGQEIENLGHRRSVEGEIMASVLFQSTKDIVSFRNLKDKTNTVGSLRFSVSYLELVLGSVA